MGALDGKSVIITGAASGIGAATTRRLYTEGACIVAADMDEAGLAGLLEGCDDTSRVLTVRTDWRKVMAVNVDGTLNACHAFATKLVAAGAPGAIVNFSSGAGIGGVPNRIGYVASKFAQSPA